MPSRARADSVIGPEYAMITKRIQKEDVYSIVDTTFIPYGSESDNYTVIGTIHSCRLMNVFSTGSSTLPSRARADSVIGPEYAPE